MSEEKQGLVAIMDSHPLAGEYEADARHVWPERWTEATILVNQLVEALEKIAEGKGVYSLDPFEHARNTIKDMKTIAKAAISRTKGA